MVYISIEDKYIYNVILILKNDLNFTDHIVKFELDIFREKFNRIVRMIINYNLIWGKTIYPTNTVSRTGRFYKFQYALTPRKLNNNNLKILINKIIITRVYVVTLYIRTAVQLDTNNTWGNAHVRISARSKNDVGTL